MHSQLRSKNGKPWWWNIAEKRWWTDEEMEAERRWWRDTCDKIGARVFNEGFNNAS